MSDLLPTFKEMAANDIDNAFFNLDEFAEVLNIDGVQVVLVNDDYALADYNSSASEGLEKGSYLFFAPISQFAKKLFIGKSIKVGVKNYLISDLSTTNGVYRVVLAGVDS